MATGRDEPVSDGSCLKYGSDFIEEHFCDPCLKDGKEVEGLNHCPKCSEYFCRECTNQHGKFRWTAGHNWMLKAVNSPLSPTSPSYAQQSADSPSYDAQSADSPGYDARSADSPSYDAQSADSPGYDAQSADSPSYDARSADSPSYEAQPVDSRTYIVKTSGSSYAVESADPPESTAESDYSPPSFQDCDESHGDITAYCTDHDVVVCDTCVAANHRLCKHLVRIETVADDPEKTDYINIDQLEIRRDSSEYVNVGDVQRELVQSVQSSSQQIKTLTEDVASSPMKDRQSLSFIGDGASSVGNTSTNSSRYSRENVVNINRDDDEPANARQQQRELIPTGKHFTGSKVQHGTGEPLTGGQPRYGLIPADKSITSGQVRAEFVSIENDGVAPNRIRVVGKDSERKGYKAVLYGEFDIATPGEQNVCYITGTCELSNGTILIVDYNNVSVKKLDPSYKVTGYLPVSSCPYGICQTKQDEVAVTLTLARTVLLINTVGFLKPTRSFQVDDGCKGVCFSGGVLFVSCGGDPGNESYPPEGPGVVGAYAMSGTPLLLIRFDNAGLQLFSRPCHITTTFGGSRLHIADQEGGVITVNRQGRLLSVFSSEHLLFARGICSVPGDNALVCGHGSNNVIQIDATGKMVAELLTEEDGIAKPHSLLFLKDSSRLLVTQWKSSMIQVFDLSL